MEACGSSVPAKVFLGTLEKLYISSRHLEGVVTFCKVPRKKLAWQRYIDIDSKNGAKTDQSNYRPISVLPVISRLFEILMTNQLYQHMDKNGQFSNDHSDPRLRSTVTCLLKNTDDWYSGLDLGKLVGLVFIDHEKAFDTVDHDILCKKLAHYGVQHRELSWFKSYLTNHKQF